MDYASAYEICFTAIYDKLEDFSKEDQAIVLNFMITIEIAMNFKDLALSHYKQIIENYTHDKKVFFPKFFIYPMSATVISVEVYYFILLLL